MGHVSISIYYTLVNEHDYGKSPFFMDKFTISMVIFHSYVRLPEGTKIWELVYGVKLLEVRHIACVIHDLWYRWTW